MRVTLLRVAVLAGSSSVSARPAFSGDFVLTNVVVYSPFQANSSATSNSSIAFDFCDQDLPDEEPIHCSIEWAVGLPPPSAPEASFCSAASVHVWFPADTYHGVKNLTLGLTHTYEDDTIGSYPYNRLTKFAELNLTYPATSDYECDTSKARCTSCDGTSLIARVTRAIA